MKAIQIIPVENLPLMSEGDRLAELIVEATKRQGTPIMDRDIVVVTHKVVSKIEGQTVSLDEFKPSEQAMEIAEKTKKEPAFVEAVLRETKEIVRIGPNSIITENRNGVVCANAGIDKSNVEGEKNLVLLPINPDESARKIRNDLKNLSDCEVAVIISDTNGRPLRMGEINVAIGVAGLAPTRDRRGEKDLFNYVLRVKETAIADELASAAELVIGQANEGIPVAIIRGYKYQTSEKATSRDLVRPKEADLFRENWKNLKKTECNGKETSIKNNVMPMDATTPQEFFDEILPCRFKPEKAKGIDVTAQVNISGPKGGSWMVEIKDQKITVKEGDHPSPKLTVGMADVDFLDLVNDKLSAQKAFFTGKIKFKGDISLALKLRDAGFL